jgi:hypothetical protein
MMDELAGKFSLRGKVALIAGASRGIGEVQDTEAAALLLASEASSFLNFFGFLALWRLFAFETYPLAFLQGLKSVPLNRCVMDGKVPSILLLDESIAFLLVEPLYLSFSYNDTLLLLDAFRLSISNRYPSGYPGVSMGWKSKYTQWVEKNIFGKIHLHVNLSGSGALNELRNKEVGSARLPFMDFADRLLSFVFIFSAFLRQQRSFDPISFSI